MDNKTPWIYIKDIHMIHNFMENNMSRIIEKYA